jgi:lipoprotein NlpI
MREVVVIVGLILSIADEPTAHDWARTGAEHARRREHDKAIAAFTKALDLDSKLVDLLDARGDAYLKVGLFKESVADFDAFLKAKPKFAPEHWRRGIALYYLGQYAEGVKQFETHKTVNPEDVENAVWHYLCNVHVVGRAKAQAALIDVTRDPRVPMAEVQKLFAGTKTVEDVLKVMNATDAKTDAGQQARFYGHLYVGLWYESEKNDDKAKEHITAAEAISNDHYMGDIAIVHAKKWKSPGK